MVKKYTVDIEETLKYRREYVIEIDDKSDINSILEDVEYQTNLGMATPLDIFESSPDVDIISKADEKDFSSPERVEYEVFDVMEED